MGLCNEIKFNNRSKRILERIIMTFPPSLSDIKNWNTDAFDTGGGSTAGAARVLGPFPFAYNTAGLNDGIELWTPSVGDVLLDAWIHVTTAFDGTTPQGDIGWGDAAIGIFNTVGNGTAALTPAVSTVNSQIQNQADVAASISSSIATSYAGSTVAVWRFVFVGSEPLLFWASQNGQRGGTAVGGTAGAGAVYLVVATPSLT